MEDNNVKKKSKKGLIIAIILIVLLVIGAIAGFIYYNRQQLELLTDEINKATETKIVNDDGSINQEAKIDMNIKSSGNYAVVEQTLKDYLNEAVVLFQDAENIFNEQVIENIFSPENINTDGPEFTETKAKIEELKQKSNEYLEKLADICNEEKLLSAIDDKGLNDYYKELYRQLATDSKTSQELKDTLAEVESTKTTIAGALDWITKVLNFLSDNKNYWIVQDGQIAFTNQSKLDEYSKLLDEAPEM